MEFYVWAYLLAGIMNDQRVNLYGFDDDYTMKWSFHLKWWSNCYAWDANMLNPISLV